MQPTPWRPFTMTCIVYGGTNEIAGAILQCMMRDGEQPIKHHFNLRWCRNAWLSLTWSQGEAWEGSLAGAILIEASPKRVPSGIWEEAMGKPSWTGESNSARQHCSLQELERCRGSCHRNLQRAHRGAPQDSISWQRTLVPRKQQLSHKTSPLPLLWWT